MCVLLVSVLGMCAEAYKVAVNAKGGIDAVVDAMRRHDNFAGVAERGCSALWNFAFKLGGCRQWDLDLFVFLHVYVCTCACMFALCFRLPFLRVCTHICDRVFLRGSRNKHGRVCSEGHRGVS